MRTLALESDTVINIISIPFIAVMNIFPSPYHRFFKLSTLTPLP